MHNACRRDRLIKTVSTKKRLVQFRATMCSKGKRDGKSSKWTITPRSNEQNIQGKTLQMSDNSAGGKGPAGHQRCRGEATSRNRRSFKARLSKWTKTAWKKWCANAAAGRARSTASAETRKQQAELTEQTVRFWTAAWQSAIKPKRHR